MKLILPLLTLFAAPLYAHPGHGHNDSVWHWFTSADHIAIMVVAIALVGFAAMALKKSRKEAKEEL